MKIGLSPTPVRVVEVHTGKSDSRGVPEMLLLATSCLEMAAELIALAYKFRWALEIGQRLREDAGPVRSAVPNPRDRFTRKLMGKILAQHTP